MEPLSLNLAPVECKYLGTAQESKEQADKEAITAVLTDDGQTVDAITEATQIPATSGPGQI